MREEYSGIDAVITLPEIDAELPLAEIYDGVTFEPEPELPEQCRPEQALSAVPALLCLKTLHAGTAIPLVTAYLPASSREGPTGLDTWEGFD